MVSGPRRVPPFSIILMVGWVLLFAYFSLFSEFSNDPDVQRFVRIYDVAFVAIPAILALVLRPDIPRRILFGDSPSLADSTGDALTGAGVGALLTIFFLASFGYSALASAFGLPLGFMSTGSKYTTFLVTLAEPVPQIATAVALNFFKVAFGEEFTLATIRLAIIGPSIRRFGKSNGIIVAFTVAGTAFASLHLWAYSGLPVGAYYAAFIASFVFTYLLFWRGFYAAVAAHGTYNSLVFIMQKTGNMDILNSFSSLTILAALVIIGLIYLNEKNRPKSSIFTRGVTT